MGRSGLYIPLDVNFSDDDKVLACSAEAQLVYVKSLLLAKRFQSDGLIKQSQLRRLTEGFTYTNDDQKSLDGWIVGELLQCGLWLEHDEGWVVAAFTVHNPTSAELAESREKEADRKRVARGQRGTKAASGKVQPDKNRVRDSESISEGSSESDLQSESESLAPPKTATPAVRTTDVLFEAVVDACGIDAETLTKSGRGPLNAALAELRGAKATPMEVLRRADNYRRRYPNAALTPSALAKNWALCAHGPSPPLTPSAGKGAAVLERLQDRAAVIDTNGRAQ